MKCSQNLQFSIPISFIPSVIDVGVVDSWVFSETPVFAVVGVVSVGGDGGVAGVGAKNEQNLTQKLIRYKFLLKFCEKYTQS